MREVLFKDLKELFKKNREKMSYVVVGNGVIALIASNQSEYEDGPNEYGNPFYIIVYVDEFIGSGLDAIMSDIESLSFEVTKDAICYEFDSDLEKLKFIAETAADIAAAHTLKTLEEDWTDVI
jgi:hypothetical protein